jgi:hypothetical protein
MIKIEMKFYYVSKYSSFLKDLKSLLDFDSFFGMKSDQINFFIF